MTLVGEKDDAGTLPAIIASLKNDFSSLSALIRTLGPPATCGGGDITIRAHYLPFRNGKPMTGELLDEIRSYICNFAMSRTEIAKVHELAETATHQQRLIAYTKLRDDAADLFMKAQKSTNRNGECGELLLYLLVEWILEAPQVLAKMSLKTNASMPIHGSDGIHVRYDSLSESLIFFWGEAKFHATIGGALDSALTSIVSTLKCEVDPKSWTGS